VRHASKIAVPLLGLVAATAITFATSSAEASMRSEKSYAPFLANAIHARSFAFDACSGAVTDDVRATEEFTRTLLAGRLDTTYTAIQ
jgi:hypothetical protein